MAPIPALTPALTPTPIAGPPLVATAPAPACPVCHGTGSIRDETAPGGLAPCWRCGAADAEPPAAELAALLARHAFDPAGCYSAPGDPHTAELPAYARTYDPTTDGPIDLAPADGEDRDGPTDADWDEAFADRLDPSATWHEAEVRQCWGSNRPSLGGPDPS